MNANPYVGPRSIGGVQHPNEKIYGRDREIDDLTNMVIADRIVLMYSPSGAGKSSVLQAGVIPALRESRFQVRSIIRVSAEPPPEVNFDPAHGNRYVLSSLMSLEEGVPKERKRSNLELSRMNFVDYLGTEANGEVLIFDQFEEILTASPMDYAERIEFFTLLGDALRHKGRWAVFAMREDYLAACDPYVNLLPTRMSNTFRLDLLGERAAMQAIQGPAAEKGVTFEEDAARELVWNLRQVNVHEEDGSVKKQPGMHLEPVQLQVVCYRLWDQLPEGTTRIGREHLERIGNVDAALAGYYWNIVTNVAQQSGVIERDLRDWFDQKLITKRNTRGQVMQGGEDTLRVTPALKGLMSTYLIRSDRRLGSIWYELAHDRLIAPVQWANREWRKKNLNPLQCQTEEWLAAGRSKQKLMCGRDLEDAKRWAAANPLRPEEREFLTECDGAAELLRQADQAEKERTRSKKLKLYALAAVVLGVMTAGWIYLYLGGALDDATAREKMTKADLEMVRVEAAKIMDEAKTLRKGAAAILEDAKLKRDQMRLEILRETPISAMLDDAAAGGEVKPLGTPGWLEILKDPKSGLPFSVARDFGTWFGRTGKEQEGSPADGRKGRLLGVGHDGFMTFSSSTGGNLFLKTAVEWLRHESDGPILVVRQQGASDADKITGRLRSWNLPAEEGEPVDRIPVDKLEKASLVILTHGMKIGPGDAEALAKFVDSGGGVLATGYGWVYAMYVRNGGKEIAGPAAEKFLDEYPLNQAMKQFGVRWTNEVARWPLK